MCGISGIFSKKGEPEEIKKAIEKMNRVQSRRGPDDEGIFVARINADQDADKRGYINVNQRQSVIAMGHRRLSIIDLSKAGHQPMIFNLRTSDVLNIDDNFETSDVPLLSITYNGEIYNFQELKKNLEKKGYKFKTQTDTEIILALYAEYGEKSFSLLRGMFTFGLWDGKKQKLFLVKDRYGIKPLYYYANNEKLVFASTVKAIIESGLVVVGKNPEALLGFLLFGSVPLPMTTVKNVLAVPADHYLVREADGNQKLVQYYDPLEFFNIRTSDVLSIDENFGTSDVQKIVRQIRNLLEDSIRHHLISDAPLGVFLSGGLDSSAIATLAAMVAENQPKSAKISVNQHFIKKWLLITLLAVFFITLLFSQTRGALLGLGAGVIFGLIYFFVHLPKGRMKNIVLGVIIILIILGGFGYRFRRSIDLMPFCKGQGGNRILDIDFGTETFQTRLLLWKQAIKIFQERPILGWGPENFSAAFEKHYDYRFAVWYDRAHNVFFDYLTQTGILGLLSYLGIFATFYWQFFKTRNTRESIKRGTHADPRAFRDNGRIRERSALFQSALMFALPVAYLVQGIVLFEVLPIYISLFLFLAFANYKFTKH